MHVRSATRIAGGLLELTDRRSPSKSGPAREPGSGMSPIRTATAARSARSRPRRKQSARLVCRSKRCRRVPGTCCGLVAHRRRRLDRRIQSEADSSLALAENRTNRRRRTTMTCKLQLAGFLLIVASGLSACASSQNPLGAPRGAAVTPDGSAAPQSPDAQLSSAERADPLEPFNQAMFTFNRKADDWVL